MQCLTPAQRKDPQDKLEGYSDPEEGCPCEPLKRARYPNQLGRRICQGEEGGIESRPLSEIEFVGD